MKIRNFSIIAHIDHGKSTLADRLLEKTKALSPRDQKNQVLDTMDLEREKGITIKAQTARLCYTAKDKQTYHLNLIDTPGHVDFTYEVSRSLAACEGALLVIDSSQGVEAQTVANTNLAIQNNLSIIPVINKIDLPQSDCEQTLNQMESIIGISRKEAIPVSAKTGEGIDSIFEAIVKTIPPPKGNADAPLKALLFDSWFDSYRGVILLARIFDGILKTGMTIELMSNGSRYKVEEIGYLTPKPIKSSSLSTGEVGYIIAGIKELSHARVGDTITEASKPTNKALKGFKDVKPVVFCGLYPTANSSAEDLRKALNKLQLNDFSFHYEPENSPALGMGFRCGFLGLLHKEIIQERLEREFGLNLITTAPNVSFRVTKKNKERLEVQNPAQFPPMNEILSIEEPIIETLIITPDRYLGAILKLLESRRGIQKKLEYISTQRIILSYSIPLNEVVLDFYDNLKSVSQGYASMDYEISGYQEADLVKLDLIINSDRVDALSMIVHRQKADYLGRLLVKKLHEVIPRQQIPIALQSAVGNKILARETIKPYRKDVLAKLYGGDYSRKMKLLDKQKEGKKRMKKIGNIDIPQEAFFAILKIK